MVCEGLKVTGPIFITKFGGRQCKPSDCLLGFFPTDANSCNQMRTTEIRNIKDVTVDVNTPVERYAIPESSDSDAIAIKVLGNVSTITIQWTIIEEPTNIVIQCLIACTPETKPMCGGVANGNTTSINNQLIWWSTVFQTNSISDAYHLYLGDCTVNSLGCAGYNPCGAYPPLTICDENANFCKSLAFHKEGALNNFRATQTGVAPVTYDASVTFFVGKIQITPNETKTVGQ